ncbi:MAG: 3-hydroxybutyryl-CoA dehydrogenase, partial [Phycisphaerales bacterium]|nr:3-hydroxybutyryl-CoA dehydrogenase [Phycisphaerales bacterium]
GTMGAGIAQVAAAHGWRVRLVDVNAEVLKRADEGMRSFLNRSVEKGKLTAVDRDELLSRIVMSGRMDRIGDVPLAVEAVIEDLAVKRQVFRALEAATSSDAVLATNTSSLRVADIAARTDRPERVVGMHFFNPAPLMPLVEIIAAPASSDRALALATSAARGWGKVTVRAKDTPGFIVNRVARGYYLEALRMLGEGVAGVEQIDTTMKTLGQFRMGPFELMDLVGLDVNYAVSQSVWEQSGRPLRLEPHEIQRTLVEAGRLGRKTGRGFYRYDAESPAADESYAVVGAPDDQDLLNAVMAFCARAIDGGAVATASPVERYVLARILATVMNEAALTLDDGVATAEDIDIAMQKGTNYPRGPLTWADSVGKALTTEWLVTLGRQTGSARFRPAEYLGRSR